MGHNPLSTEIAHERFLIDDFDISDKEAIEDASQDYLRLPAL
ncbi:MAG: hypothetical protein PHS89_05225 [Syntrophaceticus schinkii]|jgi:hypothetical protein|nr:hypothetical protein [Syntrophaceticus schinkii]